MGIYNKLTKITTYLFRTSQYYRGSSWISNGNGLQASTLVDFEGKAGSYRNNVSVNVENGGWLYTGDNYLVITSSWSLFEKGVSAYTAASGLLTFPTLYSAEMSPLSVKLTSGMYMAVFPFTVPSTTQTSIKFWIDNLHMPYNYDLPNCYMYVVQAAYSFQMTSYNAF